MHEKLIGYEALNALIKECQEEHRDNITMRISITSERKDENTRKHISRSTKKANWLLFNASAVSVILNAIQQGTKKHYDTNHI
jgi:hypothetical protein